MSNYVYFKTESGAIHRSTLGKPWDGCEAMSRKDGEIAWREDAKRELRALLKPGDTVHCVLRNVSRSGMSREISLFIATKEKGKPAIRDITWLVCQSKGEERGRHGGIVAHGCGMDMGFAEVYNLGFRLWPNGTRKAHGTRNGKPDRDGGYALNHNWL